MIQTNWPIWMDSLWRNLPDRQKAI